MIRLAVLLSLVAAVTFGMVSVEAQAPTVIAGTVKSKAGRPLAGLALLERGEIHNNV
jgi:hypothetical protein